MMPIGENRTVGLKLARRILECGPMDQDDCYLLVGNLDPVEHLLTL